MKIKAIIITIIVALMAMTAAADENALLTYILSIGDYYDQPYEYVEDVMNSPAINDEEIPVVFFLSEKSGQDIDVIVRKREAGLTWQQITDELKLGPENYYVMIVGKLNSPCYADVLNKYNSISSEKWDQIELTDEEIVNLVNLQFIYKHHDYSPFKVIKLRDQNYEFAEVNLKVKQERMAQLQTEMAERD